jgi:glycosyltransferase involved in cell wall biosynthesis
MRLLWASNAPWVPTGYGVQTALVTQRLLAAGHEIAVGSNFGLQGASIEWEGIPVLPSGTDAYSNDILPAQYMAWMAGKPGWLITLYDVWVFKDSYFKDINVASWTPVDHYPAPPGVVAWAKIHETIAMSRYGESALADKGVKSTYIPHAVDTNIFKPGDRAFFRKALGIPDDVFAVMINAANKGAHPPRKSWSENFGALSVFMQSHPDVHVYVHSDISGVDGVDLAALAGRWALDPDRVHFVTQLEYKLGKFTPDQLAAMYGAADVLLATSMGEGFGVPTIEAQACGTPVIVSKFSASPELVGGGWLVDGQPEDDPLQGAYFFKPFIRSIVDALEQSYEARGSEEVRAAALAKAQEYDADRVFAEFWVPYIARLDDMLKPKALPRSQRRAQKRKRAA